MQPRGHGSGGTLCLSYEEKPLVMDQTLLQQGIAGATTLSCTYMATDVAGMACEDQESKFLFTPNDMK